MMTLVTLSTMTDLALQLLVLDVTDILEVATWRSRRNCKLPAGLAWDAAEVWKWSVEIVANGDTTSRGNILMKLRRVRPAVGSASLSSTAGTVFGTANFPQAWPWTPQKSAISSVNVDGIGYRS